MKIHRVDEFRLDDEENIEDVLNEWSEEGWDIISATCEKRNLHAFWTIVANKEK